MSPDELLRMALDKLEESTRHNPRTEAGEGPHYEAIGWAMGAIKMAVEALEKSKAA